MDIMLFMRGKGAKSKFFRCLCLLLCTKYITRSGFKLCCGLILNFNYLFRASKTCRRLWTTGSRSPTSWPSGSQRTMLRRSPKISSPSSSLGWSRDVWRVDLSSIHSVEWVINAFLNMFENENPCLIGPSFPEFSILAITKNGKSSIVEEWINS